MKELPSHLQAYKRTPTFTETSIPAGLLKNHTTIPGAWAKIVVEEGELDYTIEAGTPERVELSPSRHGVVEPEVPHHVTPRGKVRFYVEFYK